MPAARARLRLEVLEERATPANLHITNLVLVDGNDTPIASVPLGEQVFLRADWTFDGMNGGEQYVVRFKFDGVNFDTDPIVSPPGAGVLSTLWPTWFASPGSHAVGATIDGKNSVAENNEGDNSAGSSISPGPITGPSPKFVYPLSSKPAKEYYTYIYVDQDPRTDHMVDYRGGQFIYDQHSGIDLGPASFSWMDAGYPILAMAPGVVTVVDDGNFDRETVIADRSGNGVVIDHGDGWQTVYWHFAANSITVKVGDTVTAGQLLGITGSSGTSGGVHLDFEVQHNFAAVETMYDPAKYYIDPPLYQGDEDPIVIDSGTSNYWPTDGDEWYEGLSGVSQFPTSGSGFAGAWFLVSNFPTGATVHIKWYRPDGTLAADQSYTPTSAVGEIVGRSLGMNTLQGAPGTWEAVLEIGGKEKGRRLFTVTTGPGEPEIRVTQGEAVILGERTTPIDFGRVAKNGAAPQQTFTINNHGYTALTTSNLVLPAGFSLVGSFPSSIDPGSSADFTVRMDTAVVGDKYGTLHFDTNDSDEGVFNFLIKGSVTGNVPAGSPVVGLPGPAVPFVIGDSAKLIDATASFTDSDNSIYANGKLTVTIIQGGSANDRLAIRNQGTGAGQVGVSGSTVSYSGTAVATFTGGTVTNPLVVTFNSAATPAAVQAVIQNATYANVATTADTRPRFMTVTAVDPSGKASNVAVKRVSLMIDPFNDAPVLAGTSPIFPAVLEDDPNPPGVQVLSFTSSRVTDPDGVDPKSIAITGVTNAEGGTWQFSLDGGTTWKPMGTVGLSAARLLRQTDYVRFLPGLNANGTATLTFRAWDQSTGLFGSTVDLSPSSATGGTTAFSTGSLTASVTITPVNDPPTFTKGPDQSTPEDSGPQTVPNWATNMSPGPSNESGQALVKFIVTNDNAALFATAPAINLAGTLTYTPAANANGTAIVTVQLQDNGGTANGGQDTSPPQTFTITVTPVNDAPVVGNSSRNLISVLEDATNLPGQRVDSYLDSTDIDADPLVGIAVTALGNAEGGAWQYSLNGSTWNPFGSVSSAAALLLRGSDQVRFIPAPNANGTATITYHAWDQTTGTAGSTANLSGSGSTGGTTAFSTGTQTANLAITPVNDAPSFTVGPNQTVLEDSGAHGVNGWATNLSPGPANESDQALTFKITGNSNPNLFAVAPAVEPDGRLTFTPASNANGSATITLQVEDSGGTANGGQNTSPTQSFTITVTPVNDPPSFAVGPNVRLMQDNPPPQSIPNWAKNISAGPPDESGQSLAFEVVGNTDPSLFIVAPAVSPTGTLTYTPAANVHGYSTITIRLKDDGGTVNGGQDTSAPQSFWIGVNPINQAPSFTGGGDRNVSEDSGPQQFSGWATDINPGSPFESDQVLDFEILSDSNAELFASTPAITPDGTLTFTSAPDANGSATIVVQLHDDGGTMFGGQDTSAPQSFTITVTPVNDPPSFIAGPDQSVLEDSGPHGVPAWATAISPGPADESGQSVMFEITGNTNPALFAVAPAVAPDGTLTFTSATDAYGTATINVRAIDDGPGSPASGDQVFTITVTPVNDPPMFVKGADEVVLEDSQPRVVANWASAMSPGPNESDQLVTFELTTDNDSLFEALPAITDYGTLTYQPAANAFGMATITVRLVDNGGTDNGGQDTSAAQTFTITVTPVNDAPTLDDIADITIGENSPEQTLALSGITVGRSNEFAQSIASVTAVSGNPALVPDPIVELNGGVWTLKFTPTSNKAGRAAISLTVTDDGGIADGGIDSITKTFNIDVGFRPVLDTDPIPVIAAIPARGKVLPAGSPVAKLTANVTDADFSPMKGIAVVGTDTKYGTWQYNLTGTPNETEWHNIPEVSEGSAWLLADDGNTQIRFVPNKRFAGFASLSYKAWDQSNEATEGTSDDTTDLADNSYSGDVDRGWVVVGKTRPAVYPDGSTVLPVVREDRPISATVPANKIVGIVPIDTTLRAKLGIAITDVGTAGGTWQYRLAKTKDWIDVGVVSSTSALLLRPTDQLRFTPLKNADGSATIAYKTWDQTGTAGTKVNPTGVDFGTDLGLATMDIKAVNDAPVLDLSVPAILDPVDAGEQTNEATFASMMSATDVEGANVGVAIIGTKGSGVWEYSTDGGASWQDVDKVSGGKALFLDADAKIRFTADSPVLPGSATLSFKAWDRTKGTVGTRGPATGTAVSRQTEVVTTAIANHKPSLDTTPDVMLPSSHLKAGVAVATLLGKAMSDPDAPHFLQGIAIVAADNANGVWQYSLGHGVWLDLGIPSAGSALLLSNSSKIRFVPDEGYNGTATIQYKAWDRAAGQSGDLGVDTTGSLNSFSDEIETATIAVTN